MFSGRPEADQGAHDGLGLNRLVVASCLPRTHEAVFQDTLRETGVNPYLLEMANIRDQGLNTSKGARGGVVEGQRPGAYGLVRAPIWSRWVKNSSR